MFRFSLQKLWNLQQNCAHLLLLHYNIFRLNILPYSPKLSTSIVKQKNFIDMQISIYICTDSVFVLKGMRKVVYSVLRKRSTDLPFEKQCSSMTLIELCQFVLGNQPAQTSCLCSDLFR